MATFVSELPTPRRSSASRDGGRGGNPIPLLDRPAWRWLWAVSSALARRVLQLANLPARLVRTAANSYKVQTALCRLGLRTAPAGYRPVLDPAFYAEWQPLIPQRDLWVGSKDPLTHFVRWAFEYRAYLTLLCRMREDATVLELGCNHGRTMLALVDYLRPPGRYEGLDILSGPIAFARANIQARHPHFRFTWADVHNDAYNPRGRLRAEDFRFPYPDASFDIVYAASLFTHLLPTAAANYFAESRRVLRKGGHCLFSFLILDYYRGKGTSTQGFYEFDHPLPGFNEVAVLDPGQPEHVISYGRSRVERLAATSGFAVRAILPGYWSQSGPVGVNEQDLVGLKAV